MQPLFVGGQGHSCPVLEGSHLESHGRGKADAAAISV